MASGEIEKTLDIEMNDLFNVIADFESYPEFVKGVKEVKIQKINDKKSKGVYKVSFMKDFTYTLDLTTDAEKGEVSWTLIESDFFKKSDGSWTLKKEGPGKTHVRYWVDVEFKIPVPGFILKGLVKGDLPKMIASFEAEARKRR